MQSSEPFYTLSKIAWLRHHGSRWENSAGESGCVGGLGTGGHDVVRSPRWRRCGGGHAGAALAAWGQAGTTLYVAPDGDDAAEGTRARPIGSCSTSEIARQFWVRVFSAGSLADW